MATLTKFEEIDSWRKARELTRLIYQLTNTGTFSRDFGLKDQIRRASVSAMSNIAEGFERSATNEFRHFFSIAKGSVGEVRSQLYVALDVGYLAEVQFQKLYDLTNEISSLIGGFVRYLETIKLKKTPRFEKP